MFNRARHRRWYWICVALFGIVAICQAARAAAPDWENEQVVGRNKEPGRATALPYPDRERAIQATREATPYYQSLNGPWHFHWVPHPDQRPVDFYKPDLRRQRLEDHRRARQLAAPGLRHAAVHEHHLPVQSRSAPRDGRAAAGVHELQRPQSGRFLPPRVHRAGRLERPAGVPAVRRRGFGVLPVDQRPASRVQRRQPHAGRVQHHSRFLQDGPNALAAEVYRYSDGSYLEDQDYFRLSGIYRNVYLWSAADLHIRDFFVHAELDEQCRDGGVASRRRGAEFCRPGSGVFGRGGTAGRSRQDRLPGRWPPTEKPGPPARRP